MSDYPQPHIISEIKSKKFSTCQIKLPKRIKGG